MKEQTFFKIVNSEVSIHRDFQLVAGKLIKIDVTQKGAEFFCADEIDAAVVAQALKAGKISSPFVSINVTEAPRRILSQPKRLGRTRLTMSRVGLSFSRMGRRRRSPSA
jgi:hypothetical protein